MVTGIMAVVFPVYFIIALRKFYGQSVWKTIVKFFTVSFLYNLLFLVVRGAALNALNLL